MGVGRADDHPAMDFGDRLDNLNPAALQIDPADGQGHQLAPPQPGEVGFSWT
jgi:hypothetical protein